MSDDAIPPAKGPDAPSAETLLVFPCRFPIKAMGRADANLEMLVVTLARRHLAADASVAVRSRSSRGGKWTSVTLTIEAHSRAQLDAIYRELTAHEAIAWVI